MVWQIVNKIDVETSKKVPLFLRSSFLEMEGLAMENTVADLKTMAEKDPAMEVWLQLMTNSIKLADDMPSPRVIKTHLPFEMLPPNLLDTCKVIFVSRNPKDCCVSFYHHHLNFPEYKFKGTFADFAEFFMEGNLEFGSYWTMLKVQFPKNKYKNFMLDAQIFIKD